MGLNLDAVGVISEASERSWDSKDALLYALGVGAGALDPTGFELEFTTENSDGVTQRVLPTFSAIVGQGGGRAEIGDYDPAMLVHGEQSIRLHGEIPVAGTVSITTKVAGMYDKGSAGLVVLESESRHAGSGALAFTNRTALFIRGAGGFGGPRNPEGDDESALVAEPLPTREPDEVVSYATRTDQALLYRLSGDRNPLHSDPTFAKRAGFDRPILHGLCTYGFTGRALLHAVCGSDPARFGAMRARFSKPTMPGDTLTVSVWDVADRVPGAYRFRTETQRGETVIDAGLFSTGRLNRPHRISRGSRRTRRRSRPCASRRCSRGPTPSSRPSARGPGAPPRCPARSAGTRRGDDGSRCGSGGRRARRRRSAAHRAGPRR